MSWKTLLLAVTFVSILFAGCVGEEDTPAAAEPDTAEEPQASASTGSVNGQVASVSLDYLEGATVFLLQGAEIRESKSDADGAFTFNDVSPGRVQVQVSHIGYQNAATTVEVVAGEVSEVSFMLEPLVVKDPYEDTYEFKGFYECAFGTAVITDTCTFAWRTAYDALVEQGQDPPIPRDPQANNKNTFYWTIGKDAEAVMQEMVWGAGGGTTERMMMLLGSTPVHNDCDCSSADYIDVTGPSPRRALIGRDLPDIYPDDVIVGDGGRLWMDLDASENGTLDVAARGFLPFSTSVGYSHAFTIYVTAFYNSIPDPDFSGIPDQ